MTTVSMSKEQSECPHEIVYEGGGAHFGDDLWTCASCGLQKYPEVFPTEPKKVHKLYACDACGTRFVFDGTPHSNSSLCPACFVKGISE